MTKFDLIIVNGKVVTASDVRYPPLSTVQRSIMYANEESSTCCIGIRNGKIRTLVDEFPDDELEGVEVIDAQ